mgnify:CR=1 FL=1
MATKKNYEVLYVIGLTNRGVFMNAFPVHTTEKSHVLVDINKIPNDIMNKYTKAEGDRDYSMWRSFLSLYLWDPDSTIKSLNAITNNRYDKLEDYELQFFSDGIGMWGTDVEKLHKTFFSILNVDPNAREAGSKQETFAKDVVDYFKYNQ